MDSQFRQFLRHTGLWCLLPVLLWGCAQDPCSESHQYWLDTQGVQVIAVGQNRRMIIPADLMYAPGNHQISPFGHTILNRLIQWIQEEPMPHLTVIGHTDHVGTQQERITRAQYQAREIAAYLWGHGLDRETITVAIDKGDHPVSAHQYVGRYHTNRYIEVVLSPDLYTNP